MSKQSRLEPATCPMPAGRNWPKLNDMTGRSRPARLLIADDRAHTRRALRAMLATQAAVELVGEAADGLEALSAVERLLPDIVILDIRMPGVDGLAATRQIKARWPRIRIVAHSLADELQGDAIAAGADAFVPKGAPVQRLLEALGALSEEVRISTDSTRPSQYS